MVKVSKWTEKELQFLVKNWHKLSNMEIGRRLDKTESAVRQKADRYITFDMMQGRSWSEYEDKLLQSLYGTISNEELSERMKRTVVAIKKRIRFLEGTSSVEVLHSLYSPSDVARFLGVEKCAVHKYRLKGEIAFIKQNSFYYIKQDDFWNWLRVNLDKPKYKDIKEEWELISPEWYRKIIAEKKFESRGDKGGAKWTSKEEALLWSEMLKGTNYKEIAEELGRSKHSVKHRASYLSRRKMGKIN